MKRRDVLRNLSLLPLAGVIPVESLHAAPPKTAATTSPYFDPKTDLFAELGVTPIINALVTMTFLSGSLMLPEVLEAINSTSHDFANMYDLQDKAGAKIAAMLKVEAAMVTSGAACALTLGTAACITGNDQQKIKALPNLPGPQKEVIMQKTHRYLFDQAVRTTGVKIVEVTGAAEMEKAINENTVMALFFNAADESSITHEEFVAVAKRRKVPTFIDAAADVPPVENLFKYQQIGFDLVTFSGGKMIRGPQSAGLLFGRKDLIEAAKLNHSPHESPIGRPMKVNKEEIFGMYAALKVYLQKDHKKEWQEWLDRTKFISDYLKSVPTLVAETVIPEGVANVFPGMLLSWDQTKIKISAAEAVKQLLDGRPSIFAGRKQDKLSIGVVLLRPDQVEIVARRIKEVLTKAM
ncbi:aminotransferase class V-fold PLP-dependent enzyme [Pseudoflavitalea sp. G-6-1-2]|uniref:aminotransferase class V-fold PLP-dependent enzyme n=1 Tax=Pseudoflavitalea sp. G-6-1-2 TaxID=2728841 RepID=UPI00146F35AF|nr:aminotransferase class V-fold PLP-dependent enzyme [Pseudoflavitalea sp. G-6-1-2]NML23113.1 aminotransferase class V-fold PLP-dependent enzyme [Pseudoflavitalea sp. G-6-1-2]